jgi:hypothetical protein
MVETIETRAQTPPDGSNGAPRAVPQRGAGMLGRVPGWYIVLGLFTLAFQVYVRLEECTGTAGCGLSLAKAVVWSIVWPLSWLVYWWGMV